MKFTDADIKKQEDFVDALRYQLQQAQDTFYRAKFERDNLMEKLQINKKHLEDMLRTS